MSSTSSPYSSSSSESMMEETIKDAYIIIHKWELNGQFISIFHDKKLEVRKFVKCVRGLHRAMCFLASHDSKSNELCAGQKLMQIAMKRLEKESHSILLDKSVHSKDDEQISNLRLVAETMISCGYSKECTNVYKIIRKSFIDEALFQLGIQSYTSSNINKMINNPHFDNHVKTWSNAVQIAMTKLFHGEKFLCDHVFASYPTIKDICFQNSTKEAALNLFKFPELIATRCKRMKSEKIFIFMSLYNSISDLMPEIESIFLHESVTTVKLQALSSLRKLGESITTALDELESSINKNSSKVTVSGGGIHPLTDSVMNYLASLADYCTSLDNAIADKDDLLSKQQAPAVSVKVEWIILVLLCKLDRKAKFHEYVALSYLFLVNNLNFVIEKVRTTNLIFILEDEWITNHEMKLNKYVSSYELMSWNKVILYLPKDLLVSPDKVRDCFRKLYLTFEEVYVKQTSWIVVDKKMRDNMKASIVNKLVPLYEEFYGKHLLTLSEDERHMKMLMRLSPENMKIYLSELFSGSHAVLRSSCYLR